MLEQSFIFLDRISLATEQKLWQQGIGDWDSFLAADEIKGFSKARKLFYDRELQRAKKAKENKVWRFFLERLPKGEHYRLWDHLKEQAIYLDIETSSYFGNITVLGMFDGEHSHLMVRNKNLEKEQFQRIISDQVLLTFNGLSFDVPVIKKYWGIDIPNPHIDLRFVCRRIGHSGGLKAIEKELGIRRADGLDNMAGEDAIYLWKMWKRTEKPEYLEKLLAYNKEDIKNLKPIAEYAIPKLWRQVRLREF